MYVVQRRSLRPWAVFCPHVTDGRCCAAGHGEGAERIGPAAEAG